MRQRLTKDLWGLHKNKNFFQQGVKSKNSVKFLDESGKKDSCIALSIFSADRGNFIYSYDILKISSENYCKNFMTVCLSKLNSLSGVTEGGVITPPSRKSSPFLQEHKNEIIFFVLSYVLFYPTKGKCYYLFILLKMLTGTAKITEQVISIW